MIWYKLKNENTADSPSLLIYEDRVKNNIHKMIAMVGNADRLIVHVKTNKMPEIVQMMLKAGINKFKCATMAEAEMSLLAGAKYIIIAHQLVGPKINRLLALHRKFPEVFIASLVDDAEHTYALNEAFKKENLKANVFLDINNGMNRTGHELNKELLDFYKNFQTLFNIKLHGLHVYDGHIGDTDVITREKHISGDYKTVQEFLNKIEAGGLSKPMIVAGGTPTFEFHGKDENVFCSPGTPVLWDCGYGDKLLEQKFEYAALVLTRVISKPSQGLITVDMGHKAIAAENNIHKRLQFLNLDNYELLSQSEEHSVVKVNNWNNIKVGDVLYAVPYHVCPTVNLYDEAYFVKENEITEIVKVVGRKRRITV